MAKTEYCSRWASVFGSILERPMPTGTVEWNTPHEVAR